MEAVRKIIRNGNKENLYSLNTKAIKKAMKNSMIDVKSCYQVSRGSSKGATTITVATIDAGTAVEFFKNLGIVDCMGKRINLLKCSRDEYTFTSVFVSQEMFDELNDYKPCMN